MPGGAAPKKGAAAATPPSGGYLGQAADFISKEEGLPKGGKAMWDPPGQNNLVSVGYGHQIQANEYKQGFIDAGGEATWQMIKFNHNSHQIDECRTLAKKLKFKDFELVEMNLNHYEVVISDRVVDLILSRIKKAL